MDNREEELIALNKRLDDVYARLAELDHVAGHAPRSIEAERLLIVAGRLSTRIDTLESERESRNAH